MADVSKQALWADRISAWEGSGLSRRAWCGQHGFNLHTLDYWRRRLRRPAAASRRDPTPRSTLVPIVVASAATEAMEVQLPNGVQLRMPGDTEVTLVAQLVRALLAC